LTPEHRQLEHVRATPRQEGVDAIRIPSGRAFRERAQRLDTGFDLPRPIYERIEAL
jgi:LDH2 family malate/lactate/ureidoglycolate dehydrogenase